MAEVDQGGDDAHALNPRADARLVLLTLLLIGGFFVAELVAAIVGSSLALFADAGHMLTDLGALAMSIWAIRLARRPATARWTYGLKRAEIVSAAVNGVTLLAIALLILAEAIQRLVTPQRVEGGLVLTVALVGAGVNVVAAAVMSRANRNSLNIRGAYLHIVTDLYAFGGTAVAGLVIVLSGWERADSIASIFVVALMTWTAWGLLRDAGRILLEASPDDIDLDIVRSHLSEIDSVLGVHDLHVWTVTSGLPTLSVHVVLDDRSFLDGRVPQILDELQQCLAGHFDVEHATFQLEPSTHAGHEGGLHS